MGSSLCSAKFAKFSSEACPRPTDTTSDSWLACLSCCTVCLLVPRFRTSSNGARTVLAVPRRLTKRGSERGLVHLVGMAAWNILLESVEH